MSNQEAKKLIATKDRSYYINAVIGLVFMFGFGFLPPLEPITSYGMQVLGIFIGVIWLWTTVGLLWPSLAGLIALGVMTDYGTVGGVVGSALGNENVLLMIFLMVIVGALEQSGITEFLARWFLTRKVLNGHPWLFTFTWLLACYVMTILLGSNAIPVVLLLWSIFKDTAQMMGYERNDTYVHMVLIGIGYVGCMACVTLPFSGLTLLFANAFKGVTGMAGDINSINYLIILLAMSLSSALLYMVMMKFVFKVNVSKVSEAAKALASQEQKILTAKQKFLLVYTLIYVVVLCLPGVLPVAWPVTQVLKSIGLAGISVIAVAILAFLHDPENGAPYLQFNQAVRCVSWDMVFLCGAALIVAGALTGQGTGVQDFVSMVVGPLLAGKSVIILMILGTIITLFLTNLANNMVIGVLMCSVIGMLSLQYGFNGEAFLPLLCYSVSLGVVLPASSMIGAMYHGNDWLTPGLIYKYTIASLVISVLVICLIGTPLANILYS